jgi:hypothetical protein
MKRQGNKISREEKNEDKGKNKKEKGNIITDRKKKKRKL